MGVVAETVSDLVVVVQELGVVMPALMVMTTDWPAVGAVLEPAVKVTTPVATTPTAAQPVAAVPATVTEAMVGPVVTAHVLGKVTTMVEVEAVSAPGAT